jgi:predicted nucleotidyltransferase
MFEWRLKMPITQNDLQTARELKKRVSEFTQLIDFRLFGSRARGDADEYSDMDIFMEFESIDRVLKNRVKNAAWEMTLETGIVVTTLLFSRYEIEDSALRSSPIIRVIMEEGVPV